MWTSALTGAIPRCMGIGISHSPRDQAVTASRMRPMISPYARARCISASSRMRIKERLADARGFGKTYQPEILFLSFAPLVDFHLVAAGQELQSKMGALIQQYAIQNGYAVVLNYGDQQSPVLNGI